jgi:hypothetical protein
MPHEDVRDLALIIVESVINRHDRPTGIAEDRIDPLSNKKL